MPLDKSASKQSIENNIKAEIAAGKSKAQSLAIALSVRRKALGQKQSVPVKPREPSPKGK